MTPIRCPLWPLGLLLLGGCGMLVGQQVEREVHDLSARIEALDESPRELAKLPPAPPQATPGARPAAPEFHPSGESAFLVPPAVVVARPRHESEEIEPVAFRQEEKLPPLAPEERFPRGRIRLQIPPGLPGADAPPIRIPTDPRERQAYFDRLYPPVPDPPALPPAAQGPEGHPLSLADLQKLGETYSPAVKNAIAAIEAARANAYDVGMYPNPSFAYEHDTVETGPAGYPGFYIDQLIKTGGKLTVQQAAATMDVLNAKLALRRAKADMWYQVRTSYFAVLVALESVRINEALFRFAEEIYEVQVDLMRFKFGAGYEPMQLRPWVLQARFNVIQARNLYLASWKQLAAAMGLPDMPPTELAGRIDMPLPAFDYHEVLARLDNHTDVRTALVNVQKAKYQLKLQKLSPLPDVGARLLVQKDYTTPPNQIAHSGVVYMTLPLWDQNRGGIRQYEWLLAQASVGPAQARNALIGTLADAFNRYVTARQQVDITLEQVRDQVGVYRGARARFEANSGVAFTDLIVIQQALVGFVGGYVTALGAHFQAVIDVANLLQTEDLFGAGKPQPVVPLDPLKDLMAPLRSYPRAPIAENVVGAGCAPPAGGPPAGPVPAPPAPGPASLPDRLPETIRDPAAGERRGAGSR